MKFKFKIQPYQTAAVDAVVDCFDGQPRQQGVSYRIDPGVRTPQPMEAVEEAAFAGFKNSELVLGREAILANIQTVQQRQNLFVSRRFGVSESESKPVVPRKRQAKSCEERITSHRFHERCF